MKKKNKKEVKTKPLKLGPPTTRGQFLEICIEFTKRAVTDPPSENDGMIEQLERLTKELKEWRKNEAKS